MASAHTELSSTMPQTPHSKRLVDLRRSLPTQDGAGVHIQRVHDFRGGLDPFLMIDELKSNQEDDYIAGFPPHPHRGFETITYILHGGITHEDSMGHKGEVHAGGAQWMSAAHGVIHSEMPLKDQQGLHGFQVWINLPAKRKLETPHYRDVHPQEMGQVNWAHGKLIAIAGHWQTDQGEAQGALAQLGEKAAMADLRLQGGSSITLNDADQYPLLVMPYRGQFNEGPRQGQLGIYKDGNTVTLSSPEDTGALLFTGPPLREPIAHYGPFVMNTEQELQQAIEDYQSGALIERAVIDETR